MNTVPTIVGAYAAMPRTTAEREDFYRGLAETGWVDGIEIPTEMASTPILGGSSINCATGSPTAS